MNLVAFSDTTVYESGFALKLTANAVDSIFVICPKGLFTYTDWHV